MSTVSFEVLLEALDLHQNLLHAEQQAISSKNLSIIEDILRQKDESLKILIDAKHSVSENYPQEVQSRISIVLDQQKKNTHNFRKLHIQENRTELQPPEANPIFKRMRKAYFN